MAQDNQFFSLRRGLDKDSSYNDIDTNDYADAQDCDFFSDNGNETGEIQPIKSMSEYYSIPEATRTTKQYIFTFSLSPNGYFINIKYANGTSTIALYLVAQPNAAAWGAALQAAAPANTLTTLVSGNKVTITFDYNVSYNDYVLEIFKYSDEGYKIGFPLVCVRDYTEATEFKQVESVQYVNYQFVLSRGISAPFISEFGVVKLGVDTATGEETRTYVRLMRSSQLNFPTTQKIILKTELFNDDTIAIYYTDFDNTPRVIYVPIVLTQDCMIKELGVGMYNLDVADQQLRLQLTNNEGRVFLKEQKNDGGTLLSGGKRYSIRFLSGNAATEWSDLSQLVPVFKESTQGAGYRVRGNKAGVKTSKSNVLYVQDANPNIFDFCEIAVVNYSDEEVASAEIIGKYEVRESLFTVVHTGQEVTQELPIETLINKVNPLILKAKTLEIKDNRLNIFNIEQAVTDDLESIFTNVTQGEVQQELNWTGKVNVPASSTERANALSAVAQNSLKPDAWSANIVYGTSGSPFYNTVNGQYVANSGFTSIDVSVPIDVDYTNNYFNETINYAIQVLVNGIYRASSGVKSVVGNTVSTNGWRGIISHSFKDIQTANSDVITVQMAIYSSSNARREVFGVNVDDTNIVSEYAIYSDGGITFYTTNSSSIPTEDIVVGEYQIPQNVHDTTGHMLDEVYCYAARVHYKNGYVSKPYPLGSQNLGGTVYNGHFLFSGSAGSSLTSSVLDFQNSTNPKVKIYGYKIDNLDISSIKNDIVGISICRADVTNPRVKAAGLFLPAHDTALIGFNPAFLAGFYASRGITAPDRFATSPVNTVPSKSYLRRYGAFVSADTLFNRTELTFASGDILRVYANASENTTKGYNQIDGVAGNNYYGYMTEIVMDNEANDNASITPPITDIDIEDMESCAFNSSTDVLDEITGVKKGLSFYNASDFDNTTSTFRGYGMVLASSLPTIPDDYGVYYAKVLTQDFPTYELDTLNYKPVHYIDVDESTPSILNNIVVWGGDTYTQKTMVKLNYGSRALGGVYRTGAISFYSQNKVNTQLRYVDDSDYPMFPYNGNLVDWLNNSSGREETFTYNYGYISKNNVNSEKIYDARIEQDGKTESRIYYTEKKPINSALDLYRIILPLNFYDLDPKDGAGVGLYDMRNGLAAIQRDAVTMLPYQSDTLIGSTTGDVVVGTGGVYSRTGNKVSTLGTELTSATYLAKNAAGNPVLYWYSTPYKKFIRYGSDGIKILSDVNNMRTFFMNTTRFIKDEFDIIMGYDANKANLYITSNCTADVAAWASGNTYMEGDIISFSSPAFQTYDGNTDFYICLQDNVTTNPFFTPELWEYIERPNNSYYNEWTLIYNEKRNAFTTFYSILPHRYFMYNNRVIIPNVISNYGVAFLNEGGTGILRWYAVNGNFKEGEMIIEPVLNKYGSVQKSILATSITLGGAELDNNAPTLTSISDVNVLSENSPSDWTYNRQQYRTSNKCDINDNRVIGTSIRLRFTTKLAIKMENVFARFYSRFRLPTK